jgi:3'-5' exonuclease
LRRALIIWQRQGHPASDQQDLELPRKASGIDGSQVEQLVQEGRITEVAAYCEEDVANTYRIWLRHELFCGRLSPAEYEASERDIANRLSMRKNMRECRQ